MNWNPLRRCKHPVERQWFVRWLFAGIHPVGTITKCEDCGAEIANVERIGREGDYA